MTSQTSTTILHCASEEPEQSEKIDLSVLQKPIQLGVSGALQVAKCLSGGTPEIRGILIEECDIIFECRICRNLFRSIANFIAHKRVYCKECYIERKLNPFEDEPLHETVIVHPEAPKEKVKENKGNVKSTTKDSSQEKDKKERLSRKESTESKEETQSVSSTDSKTPSENQTTAKKKDDSDHSGEIKETQAQDENLIEVKDEKSENKPREIVCEGTSQPFKFYSEVAEREEEKTENSGCTIVEFQNIKGTQNAKRQHVLLDADEEDVKQVTKKRRGPSHADLALISENIDSHRFESMQDAVWTDKDTDENEVCTRKPSLRTRGGDGEVTNPIAVKLSLRKDCDVKTLTCLKCKSKYSSVKTLHFHMMSLHAEKQTFFPCLYCKAIFTTMAAVSRHIQRSHDYSKEHVEKVKKALKRHSFTKAIEDIGGYDKGTKAENLSGLSLRVRKTKRQEEHLDMMNKMEKKAADTLLRVKNRIKDDSKKPKVSSVNFGTGFCLHKCTNCNKSFAKKDSLIKHQSFCLGLGAEKQTKLIGEKNDSEKKNVNKTSSKPLKNNEKCNSKAETKSTKKEVVLTTKDDKKTNSGKNKSSKKEDKVEKVKRNDSSNSAFTKIKPEKSDTKKPSDKNNELACKPSEKPSTSGKRKSVQNTEGKDTDMKPNENVNTSGRVVVKESLIAQIKKIVAGNLNESQNRDIIRICEMIDEEKRECLKCNRTYGNVSNLHRHATRHLGWKRFRCTLCEFTAFHRSECKTHLHRVHLEKTPSNMDRFILDLEPEKIKGGVSSLSRVEATRPSSLRILHRMQIARRQKAYQEKQERKRNLSESQKKPSGFNISTRMSPRSFDITPYSKEDSSDDTMTKSETGTKSPQNEETDSPKKDQNKAEGTPEISQNDLKVDSKLHNVQEELSREKSKTKETNKDPNAGNGFDITSTILPSTEIKNSTEKSCTESHVNGVSSEGDEKDEDNIENMFFVTMDGDSESTNSSSVAMESSLNDSMTTISDHVSKSGDRIIVIGRKDVDFECMDDEDAEEEELYDTDENVHEKAPFTNATGSKSDTVLDDNT